MALGAVGGRRERRPGAALGVVEDLGHTGAQLVEAVALGELEQAALAGQVGGPLGAQVGEPLLGLAHARGEPAQPSSSRRVGGITTPSSSSRVESAGIPPGVGAADVGMVGAARGEAEQLAAIEDRGDQGDVGQVGAARGRGR